MKDTPPPLPQMLCFALYSANHAMQAAYKPMLDAAGLTYPQFLVLTLLWAEDDQTMSRIGAALHLESNTLTPMLKRMEAAGLVVRNRDPEDERQVRLTLTEAGSALRLETAGFSRVIGEKTKMTSEALDALRASIVTLRDILREGENGQA
ncbi:MarR family winged helix-turn-helix transcriptional regulator [Frigidibacter sp.]|uniref:MarR family winged helix-turn-helix transcriptional regulator n=1 Tax=Frigidibacter sp. TaxID=2586418 RepID=UPI0027375415|nr:MarR family transcriptional regulator [Frigidibacter sp.]MDP3341714.1 MarR family transcriptional regulator [Frigidibacter sp.]